MALLLLGSVDAAETLWTSVAASDEGATTGVELRRLPAQYPGQGAEHVQAAEHVAPLGLIQSKELTVWDRLTIDGHIRVRQETDFERIARPTRNRQRLRARLAVTYAANDEVTAGIRWTTGDRKIDLEPADRQGSPLSYQDTGDVFDKFEFNLDRIFVSYQPCWLPEFRVVAGKFKTTVRLNPIFASPVGDLTWDEAVHPEGVAAAYTWHDVAYLDHLYWTAGESAVLELSNQDEASLFYTQVWGTRRFGSVQIEGGLAWYDWHNLNPDGNTRISFENNFGNAVVSVGPDPQDVVFASQFSILNPSIVLTFDSPESPWAAAPAQLVWEAFHNARAFDSDRDTGYSLGMQYGPALRGHDRGAWKAYYVWSDVQQESVFTPVAQDDFLRATNFRGHWIGMDFYPWDNIEARLWLLSAKPILPIDTSSQVDLVAGSRQEEWRGRLDVTVYF